MKYCPKCKKLFTDDKNLCNECKNSELIILKEGQTPVYLCNCSAAQREMLMSMLKENEILSSYKNHSQPGGFAMESFEVFVPADMYKDAYNIAVEMGMIEMDEDFCDSLEKMTFQDDLSDYEDMSQAKRTTVKFLSALLLIVVFALVIFGVDYIMEFIKNLLS